MAQEQVINTKNSNWTTQKLTQMAMLAAVSIVLIMTIRIPFGPAPYLEFDFANVPILLAAFIIGPLPGLLVLTVTAAIQAFFLGGNGIIGFTMHMVSSGALILLSGLLYSRLKQCRGGMIISLVVGALAMAALMVPLNLLFTPILFNTLMEDVVAMIIPIILPFNLLKALLNCTVFYILFKALRPLLKLPQA